MGEIKRWSGIFGEGRLDARGLEGWGPCIVSHLRGLDAWRSGCIVQLRDTSWLCHG